MKTLGDWINTLERFPPELLVRFDNWLTPDYFCSWRGDYYQLGLIAGSDHPTVKSLLELCHDINGATESGWKGGEYTMDLSCEVYMERDPGNSSGVVATGVCVENDYLVISTHIPNPTW